MIVLLLACGQDIILDSEVTVPAALLTDITWPHRVILGFDIPGTLNNQISLGEICAPSTEDLVLVHTVTRTGCAQTGTVLAWLEPASTDASCELSAGSWEALTEPPQGAPQASMDIFDGDRCRSGTAEVWLTLGAEADAQQ